MEDAKKLGVGKLKGRPKKVLTAINLEGEGGGGGKALMARPLLYIFLRLT